MTARAATLVIALVVGAGCGSAPDAPPSGAASRDAPRLSDGTAVSVDRARRRLVVGDEEAPAGFGPTNVVVGADDRIYVVDTAGGSVLLFRRDPELRIVRRAAVPGRPYGATIDRERGRLLVAVTATNEVVELTADGAPRIKRRLKASP